MAAKGRILIADDDAPFLKATAAMLRARGFECDCVGDAAQAIERLQGQTYDALISDIDMPGNRDLRFIRELPTLAPGLPTILMTAYPNVDSAVQSIALPVVAYLVKPVAAAELVGHLQTAVDRSRAARAVAGQRQKAEQWFTELQTIQDALRQRPQLNASDPTEAFLTLTLSHLMSSLLDLRDFTAVLGGREHAVNAAQEMALARAIEETIRVLEKTKQSFRSKELADLRHKLESLVRKP
jgi:DNA-binding response OmpR family regulator